MCRASVWPRPPNAMVFTCSGFQLSDSRPITQLPFYSLHDVAVHDNYDDCWIILFDRVYDVTKFIQSHPGGETVLLEHAGRDATFTFLSTGHGQKMLTVLEEYLVGILPSDQHLFLKSDFQTSI